MFESLVVCDGVVYSQSALCCITILWKLHELQCMQQAHNTLITLLPAAIQSFSLWLWLLL